MSSSLNVLLYRSLLKACRNGRHPEVFGEFGSYFTRAKGLDSVPDSPAAVRLALRHAFAAPPDAPKQQYTAPEVYNALGFKDEAPDAFTVLRRANALQACLWPKYEDIFWAGKKRKQEQKHRNEEEDVISRALTNSDVLSSYDYEYLPVFEYGHSVLCGEAQVFTFFEPRYKLLAREAVENQGYFILVTRAQCVSNQSERVISSMERSEDDDDLVTGYESGYEPPEPGVGMNRERDGDGQRDRLEEVDHPVFPFLFSPFQYHVFLVSGLLFFQLLSICAYFVHVRAVCDVLCVMSAV